MLGLLVLNAKMSDKKMTLVLVVSWWGRTGQDWPHRTTQLCSNITIIFHLSYKVPPFIQPILILTHTPNGQNNTVKQKQNRCIDSSIIRNSQHVFFGKQ